MQDVKLTEREEEILTLVVRGKSNKEIAKTLYLSVFTVQTHLSNINQKLGVTSRTEAAWLYWKKNFHRIVEANHGGMTDDSKSSSTYTASSQAVIKTHQYKKVFLFFVIFTLMATSFILLLSTNRNNNMTDAYYTVSINGTTKNVKVGDVVVRGTRNNWGYCEFPEVEENEYMTSSIHYTSIEYIVEDDCDLVLSSIVLQKTYLTPEPLDPDGSFIEPLERKVGNE